jgi:CBS-domain-containing membrane protein
MAEHRLRRVPVIDRNEQLVGIRDLMAGRTLRCMIKAHGGGSKTVQRIKAELADEATASQR